MPLLMRNLLINWLNIIQSKKDSTVEIICGGGYDKTVGYFIEPTIIVAQDPQYIPPCAKIFLVRF
jgi:acyl-CoA reductase-like NAD-dependent aldehyde dehydrogenase